jgi:uncharacterized protein (TIGR03067 family)
MKMNSKTALAITALSILMPGALIHSQDAVVITQPTAAQTQSLQGTWKGVLAGRETAGKITITITGNSLHFQGLDTNEWYDTTFTLPPGTDPQQLHATIKVCPRPDSIGKVVFAIFKIEDGTLTLVGREASAQEPPKTFDGDRTLFGGEASVLDEPKTPESIFRFVLKKAPHRYNPPRREGTWPHI